MVRQSVWQTLITTGFARAKRAYVLSQHWHSLEEIGSLMKPSDRETESRRFEQRSLVDRSCDILEGSSRPVGAIVLIEIAVIKKHPESGDAGKENIHNSLICFAVLEFFGIDHNSD